MQESSLAKWLRWLVYSSALVPLVIFAQFISPFHFGKVIVLRIIVETMGVLYLLLIWRDRSYLPKSHPITWAFLAFTVAFTLTTITSVAPAQSFWGTLERMGGLFTFWHYFIFYVIAVSVLRTKAHWQTLLDLMVSIGLLSALYGMLQRFDLSFIIGSDGRERIFGTLGNPALFAGYQILIAFLAATLALTKQIGPQAGVPVGSVSRGAWLMGCGAGAAIIIALLGTPLAWLMGLWLVPMGVACYGLYLFIAGAFGRGRAWYLVVAAITAIAAAMTAVRGSLLAIVIGSIVFLFLYTFLNRSRKARTFLLGSIGAVAVFVVLAVAFRHSSLIKNSPYLSRVTDFSSSSFTVKTRFWAWSAGLKGFSENPRTMLVGWGPENFNVPFSKYFNPKFFTGPGSETFFDRAHNMFVEVLVTMGVIGELAYLAIFVALFWACVKLIKKGGDERMLGIGLTALTVAYMIHNSFIFDTSANFLTFFTILAFATHLALRGVQGHVEKIEKGAKVRPARWTALQKSAAIALSISGFIFAYSTGLKPAKANFTTTRAIVIGWQGDFAAAVNGYRKAIDYNTPGKYEFRQRFTQYLLEASSSAEASKIPDLPKVILSAVEDMKHSAQENPTDYLSYLYLSRLYILLGQSDASSPYNQLALENSTKALTISPTFVRTYYEIGQAYLNMKQYDKSFAAFTKAAELNPDVSVTYWYMGIIKYQAKDIPGALKYIGIALQKGYSMTENDTEKLINIYVQIGDIKSVAALYEQLAKDHPDNSQYLASLAVAYVKLGRVQEAIAAVHKAIAINPQDTDFVQQATAFLHQLGAQ